MIRLRSIKKRYVRFVAVLIGGIVVAVVVVVVVVVVGGWAKGNVPNFEH